MLADGSFLCWSIYFFVKGFDLKMENILKHLVAKNIIDTNTKIRKLSKGGSDANLFELNCANGDYVIKNYGIVTAYKLGSENEYQFYRLSNDLNLTYLPKVIYIEKHDELGIIIVFKKYKDISVAEWDLSHQQAIADIIAQIHSKSDFFVKQLNIKNNTFRFPAAEEIKKAYTDWYNVLDKHGIDNSTIDDIQSNFSRIINFMKTHSNVFIHGDFHPENSVLNENNEIILIDWSNFQLGSKGEIAFFISRGYDSGINIHEDEIKTHYLERYSYYADKPISMLELNKECNMNMIFVNYLYSAYYLQESETDRVQTAYEKLITSYNWLLLNKCL